MTQVPLVVWRRRGCCRSRLLRVFLSPRGWHVVGDGWKESAAEWLARAAEQVGDQGDVEMTLEARDAGRVVLSGLRQVSGVDQWLDHDEQTWPADTFQIGCDEHRQWVQLSELAADCRRSRQERQRVTRDIYPPAT